jgi:hypothetical protein
MRATLVVSERTIREFHQRIYRMPFDYAALAELHPTRSWKCSGRVTYKRFEIAAEAVRFAMEELPSEFLLGTWLEVGEERFNGRQIRLLYESRDYPLLRKLPLSGGSQAAQDLGNKIGYLSTKHAISSAEIRGLIDCSAPTKRNSMRP